MKQKSKTTPDTDTVVEAEVLDEVQPQTRREFLVAHTPPGEPGGFIDTDEVLRRLPMSRGTLRARMNDPEDGIPYIRLNGGRKIAWHWPSVEAWMLRHQRGGGQ
jgi:predicted DNA-binding transcriptional regulator AlpA